MRVLSESEAAEIESILGRSLSSEELEEAPTIAAISPVARVAASVIAIRSSHLAIKYLRQVAPGVRVSTLAAFLEDMMSPNGAP